MFPIVNEKFASFMGPHLNKLVHLYRPIIVSSERKWTRSQQKRANLNRQEKKKSFFHCTRFVRSYAVVIIIRLECHTFLFIFFFITVMRMPLGIRYVVSGPTVFTYVKKKKEKTRNIRYYSSFIAYGQRLFFRARVPRARFAVVKLIIAPGNPVSGIDVFRFACPVNRTKYRSGLFCRSHGKSEGTKKKKPIFLYCTLSRQLKSR